LWSPSSPIYTLIFIGESASFSTKKFLLAVLYFKIYLKKFFFKFPDNIFKFADALLEDYEGNIHKALPLISKELIQGSCKREAEINAKNKRFKNCFN